MKTNTITKAALFGLFAVAPSALLSVPAVGQTGAKEVKRFAGETRFETAVAVSKDLYDSTGDDRAKAVILARADVPADSLSAVPLAEEIDAPVLLTQQDTLHPSTATEIKRLLPTGGKVVIMGGQQAISKKVEDAVRALGGQVERIAGPNRAATAVETAKRLHASDKLENFLVVDGTDWQADLIAGTAAAEVDGAVLLTNGQAMAPETAAFLKANAAVKPTAIGTVAKNASKLPQAVEGADSTALSLAVAKRFFTNVKAVGVATTADFADALAGGVHIAEEDGPMLLVGNKADASMAGWVKANATITKVMVYGGTQRVSDELVQGLTK